MQELNHFELRTLPGLWREYERAPRRLAFQARTPAGAEAWQAELRQVLTRLLGGFPAGRCSLDPHLLAEEQDDGFIRQLLAIQTRPGEYMPVYALVPQRAAPPYKPVIALHGHGTWGASAIAAPPASPAQAEFVRALNYDYARQLARRGYLVLAPELRGFGLRLEDPPLREAGGPEPEPAWTSSCKAVAANALLLGHTLLGLRVWDVMRLVDYIYQRPEPLAAGLGCVGLSGGGMAALFTTVLEPRISCAVVSGYFNTFRHSIMALDHCFCNYVPGILQYAEMADIAGLVAPRPLLVEAGTQDPIFPVEATHQALATLRPIYELFGVPERLEADIFEGEHRWSGAKAYDFLARWLRKEIRK